MTTQTERLTKFLELRARPTTATPITGDWDAQFADVLLRADEVVVHGA